MSLAGIEGGDDLCLAHDSANAVNLRALVCHKPVERRDIAVQVGQRKSRSAWSVCASALISGNTLAFLRNRITAVSYSGSIYFLEKKRTTPMMTPTNTTLEFPWTMPATIRDIPRRKVAT